MSNDKKLSGGTIPGVAPRVGGEYDKFVQDNIGKAIIGTPVGDGGVKPLEATSNDTKVNTNTIELPSGISASQANQIQEALKAIIEGKPLVNPVQPQRDMIVPDNQMRAWNPQISFAPQAKLSDMESSVGNQNANPNAVISHARPNSNLNPKEGCSPVLIDVFNLLTTLVAGRWILPGSPSVETTLTRLRREIEDK